MAKAAGFDKNDPRFSEGAMAGKSALAGIPVLGSLADKASAAVSALANPITGVGAPGASLGERYRGNLAQEQAASKAFEAEHPIQDATSKVVGGTLALAPLGATALGAKALGLVGETLPAQMAAGGASGAAIGVADAAARGDDIASGTMKGAAFGSTGPILGRAVGKAVQSARDLVIGKPSLPSTSDIKGAANTAYDNIRDMNVVLKPEAIQRVAGDLKSAIDTEGFKPYLAGRAHGALDEFADADSKLNGFSDLHGLRRVLGKAADSIDPTEKAAAVSAKSKLDKYLENIPPEDVVSGDANLASQMLRKANANYAAAQASKTLQDAITKAQRQASSANSGMNFENAARQRVRRILDNPKLARGFTADEKSAMEQFVSGDRTANVIRTVSNLLGGGGGLGQLATAGAGMMATGSPIGLAAPIAGTALKKVGNRMTMAQLQRLDEMVRGRAPESAMASALRAAIEQRRAQQLAMTNRAGLIASPGLAPAFAGQNAQ